MKTSIGNVQTKTKSKLFVLKKKLGMHSLDEVITQLIDTNKLVEELKKRNEELERGTNESK